MFRKRYTVVIVGETGSSAAQRSEISRHRTERDAQLAAQHERTRLGSMHGDQTGQYRVVVEREGEVISTGPIADLSALPPEITLEAAGAVDDDSPTDPGRSHHVLPAADDAAAPAAADPPEAPEPGDTGAAAAAPPEDDDLPSGPVPEDVLRRFEEAIAREQQRNAEHLHQDGQPAHD